MSVADYFQRNTFVDQQRAVISRNRALAANKSINIIDPVVDESWSNLALDSERISSYYDYFYSGQDVKCYVAEIDENDAEFGRLPLVGMGYSIKQEKMPVYGYWSNTYDGVMRGSRVVNGQFILATRYPNYMKNLLARAAANRSSRGSRLAENYPARSLTEDDANIQTYWDKTIDVGVLKTGSTEWAIHPPFNFVIIYGIQDTSTTTDDLSGQYNASSTAMLTDHNQRLVDSYSTESNKIVLEACELTSVQKQYTPDGNVLIETYEFFARDQIVPPSFYKAPTGAVRIS